LPVDDGVSVFQTIRFATLIRDTRVIMKRRDNVTIVVVAVAIPHSAQLWTERSMCRAIYISGQKRKRATADFRAGCIAYAMTSLPNAARVCAATLFNGGDKLYQCPEP